MYNNANQRIINGFFLSVLEKGKSHLKLNLESMVSVARRQPPTSNCFTSSDVRDGVLSRSRRTR